MDKLKIGQSCVEKERSENDSVINNRKEIKAYFNILNGTPLPKFHTYL